MGGILTDRQDELVDEAMDNIGMAGARFGLEFRKRLQGTSAATQMAEARRKDYG